MHVFPRHSTRFLVFCTDETDDEDGREPCTGRLEFKVRCFSDVPGVSGDVEVYGGFSRLLVMAEDFFDVVDEDAIGLGRHATNYRSSSSS